MALRIVVVDEGGRRFFDDFLVTALNRALALKQVEGIAMRVTDQLDLDVMRAFNKFLDKHTIVAEAVACASLRQESKPLGRFRVIAEPHASPLPPPPAEALIMTG
jgi:hypothetical protein